VLIRAASGVKHGRGEFDRNLRELVDDAQYREGLRRKLALDIGSAPYLGVVAKLGDIAEEEIPIYAEAEGLDPDAMRTWLDWAEHLSLAVRSGPKLWRLNPLITNLLRKP
jgi:hypothetical protein